MEKKYFLFDGGTPGVAAIALIVLVILVIAAYLVFGGGSLGLTQSKELNIISDPALFEAKLIEEGITLTSDPSNYCLTCDITYSNPGPMKTTMTSEELTSYLQATNNERGPLKNIQVRLGDDNEAEVTADVDLSGYGYDFTGPIYAKGRLDKASDTSVALDIYEASSGPLPIPGDQANQGEDALEDLINQHLAKMPGLQIDSLEIEDGLLQFEGNFPKGASA